MGAIFTLYLGALLKTRSEKRRYCLNAIAILSIYLEELETGLNILQDDLKNLKNDVALVPSALPKASWENYQLSEDSLNQLWMLKDKGEPTITSLPSHLKNCFEHITKNVVDAKTPKRVAGNIGAVWTTNPGSLVAAFTMYRDGYEMTINLVKRTINLLDKRKDEFWVKISEP